MHKAAPASFPSVPGGAAPGGVNLAAVVTAGREDVKGLEHQKPPGPSSQSETGCAGGRAAMAMERPGQWAMAFTGLARRASTTPAETDGKGQAHAMCHARQPAWEGQTARSDAAPREKLRRSRIGSASLAGPRSPAASGPSGAPGQPAATAPARTVAAPGPGHGPAPARAAGTSPSPAATAPHSVPWTCSRRPWVRW